MGNKRLWTFGGIVIGVTAIICLIIKFIQVLS